MNQNPRHKWLGACKLVVFTTSLMMKKATLLLYLIIKLTQF